MIIRSCNTCRVVTLFPVLISVLLKMTSYNALDHNSSVENYRQTNNNEINFSAPSGFIVKLSSTVGVHLHYLHTS